MRNYIDDALKFGAMFDIITPVKSLLETAMTDRKHYGVPASQQIYIDIAAKEMGIHLHNRSIFSGQYQFDCEPGEWRRISAFVGL